MNINMRMPDYIADYNSPWVGKRVRLNTGEDPKSTSIVQYALRTIKGGVFLWLPLAGFRYWNISELEIVEEDTPK